MSPLAQYCAVADVLRKFNPQLTAAAIAANDYIGNEDRAQIRARIEAVSDAFDQQTGHPYRERRVGAPDEPRTWEYHDASRRRGGFPLLVDLGETELVPIDPATDTLEVRTGRDSWTDVTAAEGDEWWLDYERGQLTLFRVLIRRAYFEAPDERYLRASYRYGALGGGRDRGGQTTLAEAVSDDEATLPVADASRLPAAGTLLVNNDEYVQVDDVDAAGDALTVRRGARATTATSHEAGAVVHYAPESIRDAVAAKAAAELLRYDDWVEELPESQGLGGREKIESWDAAFETALATHSGVRVL